MFVEMHVKFPWKPPLLFFESIFIKHLSLSENKLPLIDITGFYFLSCFFFCPKFLNLGKGCKDAEGAACQCFLFNIFYIQDTINEDFLSLGIKIE